MRIAVVSSLSWPFIRRGNRCSYELATWLASHGHEVRFITAAPGSRHWTCERDGLVLEYLPLSDSVLLTGLKVQKLATFVPPCVRALRRGRFDLVQTTYPVDAFAASVARSLGGPPFVHLIYDCNPFHPPDIPGGRWMWERALRNASGLSAISRFVNDELRRLHGRDAAMIPLAVDLAQFPLGADKDPRAARILCTASRKEPRKRVELLVRSFAHVAAAVPEAELQLCGHSDDATDRALLALVPPAARERIVILPVGRRDDLPALYRQATLSVLPSLNEAFGLVVTESLASGTPVVGTRSGALPEILDDPGVGVLFDAQDGPGQLAAALLAGLELARRPGTPARCRQYAEQHYGWSVIGPQYEVLHRAALAQGAAGERPRLAAAPPRAGPPALASAAPGRAAAESPALQLEQALDDAESSHEDWFDAEWRGPTAALIARQARAVALLPCDALVVGSGTHASRLLLERLGCTVTLRVAPGAPDHGTSRDPQASHRWPLIAWHAETAGGTPSAQDLERTVAELAPGGLLLLFAGTATTPQACAAELAAAGLIAVEARRVHLTHAHPRGWGSTPVRTWIRTTPRHALATLVPWLRKGIMASGRMPP